MGEVLVVEHLGDVTYAYVRVEGGDTLIVQVDGNSPIAVHDRLPLRINSDRCHLFNSDGMAIPKARQNNLNLEEIHEHPIQPIQPAKPQPADNNEPYFPE